MLLPQGKCIWKNLSTFFVNIRALMQYIRDQDFDGYIYINLKNEKGIMFLHEGDFIFGILEYNNEEKKKINNVKEILDYINGRKKTLIDVYSLSNRSVEIITDLYLMEVKPYQTNLSSEFFNIESYINNYLNKINFNGYVEIYFQDGEEGIVSLHEGKVNTIITDSLQLRRDRATQSELRVFDMYALKLLERAQSKGAKYDIYAYV